MPHMRRLLVWNRYTAVEWLLDEPGYAGTRKLLFKATTTAGKTLCVKFTQTYNRAVHAAWAEAGLAPELHSVEDLPGKWFQVNMELLGEGWECLDTLLLTGRSTPQVSQPASDRPLHPLLLKACRLRHQSARCQD